MNREKLSTAPFSLPKKAGMKREPSPYDPYKRKARGKENNPGSLGTGLFACERPRACVGIRKRLIQAAVEDALRIFCGTRRGKYCDRNLWAKFAWRFGWGLLRELTLQGEALSCRSCGSSSRTVPSEIGHSKKFPAPRIFGIEPSF